MKFKSYNLTFCFLYRLFCWLSNSAQMGGSFQGSQKQKNYTEKHRQVVRLCSTLSLLENNDNGLLPTSIDTLWASWIHTLRNKPTRIQFACQHVGSKWWCKFSGKSPSLWVLHSSTEQIVIYFHVLSIIWLTITEADLVLINPGDSVS